ncbi:MAG: methionine--tRNA ligase [Oscillospiraceae bacterium]|nr:methionine--tRNA ligase [Oscillospiraceae bacterium]
MPKPTYFITTAIPYATQKPHIGNFYDHVVCDLLARHKRMQGYDVCFLTGMDEHGQKVETLATQAGISPQAYADGITSSVLNIFSTLDISCDRFIRTTDAQHEAAVAAVFQKLYTQGDIYKSAYEGQYCVPCESFWTQSQLTDGNCPDCGRPVTPAKEDAYFLRLSKYQSWLEAFYDENPHFILPDTRRNEMLNTFIKPGLQDLCVTRSTFRWGVPVPFDPQHVVYVWIDALLNYTTALGYNAGENSDDYRKYWPADVHVIGKDICRFHTIVWPILLHALGEPLPKRVFAHPWLLVGADKMSKSRGNVIYADALAARIGGDAVRYFMLAEMPSAVDGTMTYETVLERYNGDLANVLGNLVNRTLAMANKYFGGVVPASGEPTALDLELQAFALQTVQKSEAYLNDYRFADAMDAMITLAKRLNKYIDETMPWALAKDEAQRGALGNVIYNLLEGIRFLAAIFAPVMPNAARSILSQLDPGCDPEVILADILPTLTRFGGLTPGVQVTETPKPLFARLELSAVTGE